MQQRLSPVNSSGSVRMKLNWFLVLCAIDFLFVDKFITFWNYCAIILNLIILMQVKSCFDNEQGPPLSDRYSKSMVEVHFGATLGVKAVPRINLLLKKMPEKKHRRSRSIGSGRPASVRI